MRIPTWSQRLGVLLSAVTRRNAEHGRYADANRDSVQRAIDGRNPFGREVVAGTGARRVVNMSSAHVPGFCKASKEKQVNPYKNCYDLTLQQGWRVSRVRNLVDKALPVAASHSTYFAVAEVNGCGIRFYGDVRLVLRPAKGDAGTVVLDRNSFEVLRSPVVNAINAHATPAQQHDARRVQLLSWSGTWGADLGNIVSIRSLHALSSRDRRWTVGQVSAAVCEDEDYVEVLMPRSFGASDLQEVRVTAEEAAQDAWIGGRLGRGPTPSLASLVWRQRRRNAERALREVGVPVRVVTTVGRTRG